MAKICPECSREFDDMSMVRCPFDGSLLVIRPEQQFREGTRIDGRFEIRRLLGKGAMGTVYLARQVAVDRLVAVKVLRSHHAQNMDVIRRFWREAKAVAALCHPHIVTMHDLGQTPDGLLYIVMEYVEGRSLARVLHDEGPLPAARAVHIGAQICDALTAVHGKGIIHRDLKPENIIVQDKSDPADCIKVVDFGIAKVSEEGSIAASSTSGQIIGTPRYMCPEMAKGLPITLQSDLYSLGVILYELISGVPPFVSDAPITLMIRHAEEPPMALKDRPDCGDLAPALDAVIMRSLAKRPESRPATAETFKAELWQALNAPDLAGLPLLVLPSPRRADLTAETFAGRQNPDAARPEQAAMTVISAPPSIATPAPLSGTREPTPAPTSRPASHRAAYALVAALIILANILVVWWMSPSSTRDTDIAPPAVLGGHAIADVVQIPAVVQIPHATSPSSVRRVAADVRSGPDLPPPEPAEARSAKSTEDKQTGALVGPLPGADREKEHSPVCSDAERETVTEATTAKLTFRTNPPGAAVVVRGMTICETPCMRRFGKSPKSMTVTLQKKAYKPKSLRIPLNGDHLLDATLDSDFEWQR